MERLGKHYMLNLYGCSFSLLDNEFFLCDLLENAAESSGAHVLQTMYEKFDPQGVTVACILAESHITIHTWPEKGEAAADIFTCGDAEPKVGCDIIIEQLKARDFTLDYVER